MSPKQQLLKADLKSYIISLDIANVLDMDTIDVLANKLTNFVEQATLKYIAGQREHGGRLGDRDCLYEANKEVIDLFWYLGEIVGTRNAHREDT